MRCACTVWYKYKVPPYKLTRAALDTCNICSCFGESAGAVANRKRPSLVKGNISYAPRDRLHHRLYHQDASSKF